MQNDMQPTEPQMNLDLGMDQDMAAPDMAPPAMGLPTGEVDHEGAMAKADLYKLANYSFKLFKKIEDTDQLEAWVQAKITKAADYIASVYHYLEYEMEFSEYGKKIENSEMYNESQKLELKTKLMEAKEKIKELKKKQADKITGKKVDESKIDDLKDARAAKEESDKDDDKPKARKIAGKAYGGSKQAADKDDEKLDEGDVDAFLKRGGKITNVPTKKTNASAGTSLASKHIGTSKGAGKSSKISGSGANVGSKTAKPVVSVEEAKSPKAKKDYDKDGKVESEKDEVIGSRRKAAGLDEASPSAGMTKKEKSSVVKKAVAGKDIGKPGKGFEKVEKAAKKGGAKDPKAVAAAAMWKTAKKKVTEAEGMGKIVRGIWVADPNGTVPAPSADQQSGPGITTPVAKTPVAKTPVAKKPATTPAQPAKVPVKESTDLDRIKALSQRLNG